MVLTPAMSCMMHNGHLFSHVIFRVTLGTWYIVEPPTVEYSQAILSDEN